MALQTEVQENALYAIILAQQQRIAELVAQIPYECRVRIGVEYVDRKRPICWQVFHTSQEEFVRLREHIAPINLGTNEHMLCELLPLDLEHTHLLAYYSTGTREHAEAIAAAFVGLYWERALSPITQYRDDPDIVKLLNCIAVLKPGFHTTAFLDTLDIIITTTRDEPYGCD